MAVRVRDFSRAYPAADGNYAAVLGQLEERIAHLESLSQEQQHGHLAARSAAAQRRALRRQVHDALRHLVRVAGAAAKEEPSLLQRFRLPPTNGTNEGLLTLAREMLAQGRAEAERLGRHGLAEKLLDDLAGAVDRFAASLQDSTEARRGHMIARQALKAESDELMATVGLLDGLNLYRFSGDPALRSTWQRTRRLDAEPKTAEEAGPASGGKEVKPAA